MSPDALVYDLDQVNFIFLGLPIKGYGEGGAIKIEPLGPKFLLKHGVDGTTMRSKDGKTIGKYKITLTLAQGSKANAALAAINELDTDASNGAGVGPVICSDLNQGSSLFAGGKCWINQEPTVEYTGEATDRVWELFCADGKSFVGGN